MTDQSKRTPREFIVHYTESQFEGHPDDWDLYKNTTSKIFSTQEEAVAFAESKRIPNKQIWWQPTITERKVTGEPTFSLAEILPLVEALSMAAFDFDTWNHWKAAAAYRERVAQFKKLMEEKKK